MLWTLPENIHRPSTHPVTVTGKLLYKTMLLTVDKVFTDFTEASMCKTQLA